MPGMIATAKDVSKNWNVYDKYSENLYIINKKKSKLIQDNPEYKQREENIRGKANSIINAIKLMDNNSENYVENIELAIQNSMGMALFIHASCEIHFCISKFIFPNTN
jgi:hypothetical protein